MYEIKCENKKKLGDEKPLAQQNYVGKCHFNWWRRVFLSLPILHFTKQNELYGHDNELQKAHSISNGYNTVAVHRMSPLCH